jgi:serine protease Do
VVPAAAQDKTPNDRAQFLNQFSSSLDALTSRVSPAVVQVQVTGFGALDDKSAENMSVIGRQHSLGSGVIVDSDGYIITNAHVVKGAQRVRVLLTAPVTSRSQERSVLGANNRLPPADATIVGSDPVLDLALLKIDQKNLPVLPFADYTKLQKGQIVLAFGNPEGLENSVTMGIVSAVARQVTSNAPTVYIQTDAPINPGNSGGPLVNTDGELVGINTFILSESGGSQGLGFAIPSSVVKFVYDQLRKQGHVHRSKIGVGLQEITPDLAEGLSLPRQDGVIVSDVQPGGPADRAGVHIQDILLSLNGRSIGSVALAEMMISSRAPDAIVEAQLLRGTQTLTLDIPVTEQRSEFEELADLNPAKALVARLGIFGVEINDKLAAELPDLRRPSGVMVAGLAASVSVIETDLQTGDVIHALNGNPIDSLDSLRTALNAIPSGGAGVLQVERDGKLIYLTFEVD